MSFEACMWWTAGETVLLAAFYGWFRWCLRRERARATAREDARAAEQAARVREEEPAPVPPTPRPPPAPQRTWLAILNPADGEPRILEVVVATDGAMALRMARSSQAAREKAEDDLRGKVVGLPVPVWGWGHLPLGRRTIEVVEVAGAPAPPKLAADLAMDGRLRGSGLSPGMDGVDTVTARVGMRTAFHAATVPAGWEPSRKQAPAEGTPVAKDDPEALWNQPVLGPACPTCGSRHP